MTVTRSVVIERELPHPPEKLWRTLTEGPLLAQWLMENDFRPVVGHRFTFRAAPVPGWNGIVDSEVLTVDPPQSLSYTWNSMGLESIVLWTLTRSSQGTLLRMEQSGFRDDQDFAFKGATYGWQKFIANLERVIAQLPS